MLNLKNTHDKSDLSDSNHNRTLRLVQIAILSAIIILMSFTPLGYLKVGPVSITFLIIPVVIGAIINGPLTGAILGGVFGVTSFAQCFGLDPFGTALLAINPFYTFILTMIPRIIMGIVPGLIFRALNKFDKHNVWSYAVAALSAAVTNTVLFVGALIILFGNTDFIRQFGDSVIEIIALLVTINALIEAIVVTLAGSAIARAVNKVVKGTAAQSV